MATTLICDSGYEGRGGRARIILLLLLARAFYQVPEARFFNRVYLIGFGIGAGIWALSLLLPQDRQWILWILSLMVELPVPWYIWFKKQPLSHISASHIPERLGLFTIIVLGESVVAPARGLTEQRWQTEAVATAAFGFLVAICVWWIYFRHLERAIGRFRLGSLFDNDVVNCRRPQTDRHRSIYLGVTRFVREGGIAGASGGASLIC